MGLSNNPAKNNTRVIPESFGKSVLLIRRLLARADLSIVNEFNLSSEPCLQLVVARRSCTVLLVDTPVLLFEAIALDRVAAVFLPIHIVISGDHDKSYVHWANPIASSGLRSPLAARYVLDDLYVRISEALSELPQTVESPAQPNARPLG